MRKVLLPFLLAIGLWMPAQAEEGESAAIRAIIEAQLEAFQRDDGSTAFSFASPIIQQQFGTPENFMIMVRQGYDPVYRPTSAQFQETQVQGGRAVQKVLLVDRKGQAWMARYFMQRQEDGLWRVNGVRLEPLPDLSA